MLVLKRTDFVLMTQKCRFRRHEIPLLGWLVGGAVSDGEKDSGVSYADSNKTSSKSGLSNGLGAALSAMAVSGAPGVEAGKAGEPDRAMSACGGDSGGMGAHETMKSATDGSGVVGGARRACGKGGEFGQSTIIGPPCAVFPGLVNRAGGKTYRSPVTKAGILRQSGVSRFRGGPRPRGSQLPGRPLFFSNKR